jgi:hypothetical protein
MISKTINQVAVSALIGAVVWVLFSIYSAVVVVPKLEVDPKALVPINGTINRKVLDEIATRKQLGIDVDAQLAVPQVASTTATPKTDKNL